MVVPLCFHRQHPPLQLERFEAWAARWWMAHYKSLTPKRHVCWSNSEAVRMLDLGKLHKFDYESSTYKENQTTKKTISKTTGKKQFTGQRAKLKNTQYLDLQELWVHMQYMLVLIFLACNMVYEWATCTLIHIGVSN